MLARVDLLRIGRIGDFIHEIEFTFHPFHQSMIEASVGPESSTEKGISWRSTISFQVATAINFLLSQPNKMFTHSFCLFSLFFFRSKSKNSHSKITDRALVVSLRRQSWQHLSLILSGQQKASWWSVLVKYSSDVCRRRWTHVSQLSLVQHWKWTKAATATREREKFMMSLQK